MTEMPPQDCLKRGSVTCPRIEGETETEKVVMVDDHGAGTGNMSMTEAEKGIVKETGAGKEKGSGVAAGKGKENTVERGIAESLTDTEMEMETRGETGSETETVAGREIKTEKTMTVTEQRTETETVTEIETAGTGEENAQGVVIESVEKTVTEEIGTENGTKTEARRKTETDGTEAGAKKRKMKEKKGLTIQGQSLQNLKTHYEGHSS